MSGAGRGGSSLELGKGPYIASKFAFFASSFPLLDSAASAGGDGRRHDQEKNKKEVFSPPPFPSPSGKQKKVKSPEILFQLRPSVRPCALPPSAAAGGSRRRVPPPLLPRERGEAVSEKKSWRNPTFFVHVCSARRPPNGRTDGGKRKRKSSQDMLTRRYTEKKGRGGGMVAVV